MESAFPVIIFAMLVLQVGGYYLVHWMCCECAHQIMDRMPRDTWVTYWQLSRLVWFPERILDAVLNVMTEKAVLEHRAAVRVRTLGGDEVPVSRLPCSFRAYRRTLIYTGKRKRDPALAEVLGKLARA